MDDWDSADVSTAATAAPVVNQWADEDASDSEAPDAWDAEPEEPKAASADLAPEKKKAITKRALAKKEEEERRLAEKMAAAQLADPNYNAQERERLRRLEEDRDAALAGDLFGSESVKVKDITSDIPGSKAAESNAAAVAAVSSSSSSAVPANASLKAGARIEEAVLDTDADVDKFVADLGKRLEKLGKSAMASKKICKLISSLTEETIKLGVLRMDDVGELKRIMTIKHNDLTTKQKKGDKKGAKVTTAKPVVALARNAFMHGDNFGSHADENGDDYDFI
jgi:hypothetical protein